MALTPHPSWDDALTRFERDAFELEADAFTVRLHELIEQAPDAVRLWRLLCSEPLEYATLTWDTELSRGDVECVFRRVLSWADDRERALGLGVLGALLTLTPSGALAPDPDLRGARQDTQAAIAAAAGEIRQLMDAGAGEVRAAAALVLGRLPLADTAAIAGLARLAAGATATERGAASLALGMMLSRGDEAAGATGEITAARASLAASLAGGDMMVATCAASALAMIAGELEQGAVAAALAVGLTAAQPLPREWGFINHELTPDTTSAVVRAVLRRVRVAPGALDEVIEAIAGDEDDGPTIVRLAFGEGVEPGGVALDECTELQRRALGALARTPPSWQLRWPLGFHCIEEEVPAFLAAAGARWTPLAVRDRAGRVRRWHAGKAWRACVLADAAAAGEVASALFAGLSALEVLDQALSRRVRIVMTNHLPPAAAWGRDRAILIAILDSLGAHGLDARAAICERVTAYTPVGADEGTALGLCLAHVTVEGDVERSGERAGRLLTSADHRYASTSHDPRGS